MAELKGPGNSAIGIARKDALKPNTPPVQSKPAPTVDPVIAAERRASYNQGKHDKGMQNFWHGALFTLVCVAIGSFFTFMIDAGNRERNMIESRVAVTGAISNAKLLAEENALPRPVVEPETQK